MSSDTNLRIPLDKRVDSDGNTYYIGKIKLDMTLNFKDGLVALIFLSQENAEELQIAPMLKPKDKSNDK